VGANKDRDFDVVVIGSGFGGSVAALRLAEKGYRVAVLEAGRRWTSDTLPNNNWNTRKFIWLPKFGCHGFQKITKLGKVLVLSGAAVGGGSVVYANTLYRPLDPFYTDAQWSHITDWRDELAPFYDQAERMLGVVKNPTLTYTDEVIRDVADEMGVGDTFTLANVGVYFGPQGEKAPGVEAPDPYFGGAGPTRTGCKECGECMTGCRWNAKNTLDRNYLYLAEGLGATVFADTNAQVLRPSPDGGYEIETVRTGAWVRPGRRTFRARQVVLAGGAIGTQKLLHTMRDTAVLPRLSERLGSLTRTNSEAILGATRVRPQTRITEGVAITSSFYPDDHTHIEPVRYGVGDNAMGLISALMTDGGGKVPRWVKYVGVFLRRPWLGVLASLPWRWSERTMIALVMQSKDNSLTVSRRKGPLGTSWLTSRQGHGEPNPTWIPIGNEATRRIAKRIGGFPGGSWTEIFNIPLTAHILGGCPIGETADAGVVDPYQRVFGHPGLHVTDGAAVTANLGVNPSLTITAQAERAMAFWPNKGGQDPRPPLGEAYQRVAAVPPASPAVPGTAPAAYRVGPVPVTIKTVRPA
jgi:cholesterol oxidase